MDKEHKKLSLVKEAVIQIGSGGSAGNEHFDKGSEKSSINDLLSADQFLKCSRNIFCV